MKRLAIVVAVGLLLLTGLDRAAAYIASRVLASHIQTQQHLASRPAVTVHGFPFLTQVIGGTYDRVDVDVRGLQQSGVRIDDVAVQAHGITVALSDAVAGRVRSVPVRQGSAIVRLTYADINAYLAARAAAIPSVSYDSPGRVRISGRLSAFGVTVNPSVEADASLDAGTVHLVPLASSVDALPLAVRTVARSLLSVSIPLTGLPFGIHLVRGTVTPTGIQITAEVTGAVFPVGGSSGAQ